MRLSRLTLISALLLGTQLLSVDPQPPPLELGRALPATDTLVASVAPLQGEAVPTYRGKRWWGLCPAYAADSVSALYREYQASPRLQQSLMGFDWPRAHLVTLDAPQRVHVAYAAEPGVAWSSKALTLPAGEVLITDRDDPQDERAGFLIRTFCCNLVSTVGRPPVRRDEPPIEELEQEWYITVPPGETEAFLPPRGELPPGGLVPPGGGIVPPGGTDLTPTVVLFPPLLSAPPSIVVVYTPPGPSGGSHPPYVHGPGPGPLPLPPESPTPPGDEAHPPLPPGLHPLPPDSPQPVPEPGTMALLALGIASLYIGRKLYGHMG